MQLRTNPFKTLGAKLFYMMSALTLLTVAGLTWMTSSTFRDFLTKQTQESTLLQAESAASEVSGVIDNWTGQLAVALPTLRGIEKQSPAIAAFVQSNADFVGLQMFLANSADGKDIEDLGSAFTRNTSDPRFEDRVPAKVAESILSRTRSWLTSRASKSSPRLLLQNLAPVTKLPLTNLAVRFEVSGSQQHIWAVLTVWQTKILAALPKSRYIEGFIIDRGGRVFSSPVLTDMLDGTGLTSPLTRAAQAGRSPAGFQDEFTGRGGKSWVGAFARISKHDGISVIIQRDAEQANLVIKQNLFNSLLVSIFFMLIAVMVALVGASGITKSLREVSTATTRIAAGDFTYRITPRSNDEVAALGQSVNAMSERILDLLRSQVDKARFEKELETAKTVQSTLFPKQDITTKSLKVSGHYQPASECGGDLWGHFPVRDNVELVFIADAMGHGAPAALITAMAYSTCMTLADVLKDTPHLTDGPSKILERLNRIIHDAVRGQISMTFFIAVIDFKSGEMTCANAGHNFPIIVPANENDTRGGKPTKSIQKISKLNPITLSIKGTPLGMDPASKYVEKKFKIEPGDKIFMFTDGLIECSAPDGSVWGRKTLIEELLKLAPTANAMELKDRILDSAFRFFAGRPIADDVTVVVAEIDAQWTPGIKESPNVEGGMGRKFKVNLPSTG